MAQKKLQRNEKKLYFCGVKINELNMNNSFFGISLNAIGESRRDYKEKSLTGSRLGIFVCQGWLSYQLCINKIEDASIQLVITSKNLSKPACWHNAFQKHRQALLE